VGRVTADVAIGCVVGFTFGLLLAAMAFTLAWQRRFKETRNTEWRRLINLTDQKAQIDRLTTLNAQLAARDQAQPAHPVPDGFAAGPHDPMAAR
jgi:hypothetical protein